MSSGNNLEIERKYLIRYPDLDYLCRYAERSLISQAYLVTDDGTSERVRKRGTDNNWHFYHTSKKHLTGFTRIEIENEISEQEYNAYLQRRDPERNVIEKTRYCLPNHGQIFEIDVYPFWSDRAVMEVELSAETDPVYLPAEIQIIKEITTDPRYTNSALARSIITEEI